MSARPPLVMVPQYFGSTVFDRRTSRYLPFDHEATALLRESVTRPFPERIADERAPAHRDTLASFFEHFQSAGFFTFDDRFAGAVLDVPHVPTDHLVGPLALHLEVVAACNLACAHCFAGELPRKERPLTLDEIDALFATLARMGTFRIGLTGGEPLLRKDLFTIIDLALAHGLCPCVTTNALLVDERVAREFGKRELAWLNVSLDGATAETNDRVRGAGTFDRVREKLALLGRHTRFTLAFTVMKHNANEAAACARLAASVGAHTAVFRPLYPVGVAREHLDLMPTFGEYSRALDALATLGADDLDAPEVESTEAFGPARRSAAQAALYQNYGCGAGNLVCSVSVSGDVNPCSFLGDDYVADNVRHTPFDRIWHDSPRFRELRATPDDGHGTSSFGGGCRARSLVLAGSAHAPDPWLSAHEHTPSTLHPLVVLRTTKSGRAHA